MLTYYAYDGNNYFLDQPALAEHINFQRLDAKSRQMAGPFSLIRGFETTSIIMRENVYAVLKIWRRPDRESKVQKWIGGPYLNWEK